MTSCWQGRPHEEFICRLRDRWPHRSLLGDRIAARLHECGYDVREASLEEASQALGTPHLSSSVPLDVASPTLATA